MLGLGIRTITVTILYIIAPVYHCFVFRLHHLSLDFPYIYRYSADIEDACWQIRHMARELLSWGIENEYTTYTKCL